jgi:hypothetical protein
MMQKHAPNFVPQTSRLPWSLDLRPHATTTALDHASPHLALARVRSSVSEHGVLLRALPHPQRRPAATADTPMRIEVDACMPCSMPLRAHMTHASSMRLQAAMRAMRMPQAPGRGVHAM